jgi:hypothetical protein
MPPFAFAAESLPLATHSGRTSYTRSNEMKRLRDSARFASCKSSRNKRLQVSSME